MKKLLLALAMLLLGASAQAAVTPGKWYAITINGKGINIPQAMTANNTPLQLWTQTNVPSQLWECIANTDGTLSFREGYLGEYICHSAAIRPGVKITGRTEQFRRNYGNWQLKPVEGTADKYTIVTTDNSCLLGAASASDKSQLALVDAASASAELTQWTFTECTTPVATSFGVATRDAIMDGFLNRYYHPASRGHVLGNGGWWGDAEMFETILDAFETTGDPRYKTIFQELVTNFCSRNGTDWSNNAFNDDITWMVLACIRGYKYFGIYEYLNYATNNYNKMYDRALEPGGALRWKQQQENWNGSNSCINCPATVAACYLYEITGKEEYLTKAKSIYAFQRANLFNPSNGQVYDSGTWNDSWTKYTMGNAWASTYNQGTMLGAATKLYLLTGEAQYRNDAAKVWEYTYNNLTNSERIVHVCQTATGDLTGFKGILMRYVRLFGQVFNRPEVFTWMEKNAWYAYQNSNSDGVIWSKWLSKTPEDYRDGDADFSNDPFGASTAVSVAFNAHVNRTFTKDAYSPIEASMFDDVNFMQLEPTDGGTPCTTKATKGYICFRNVEFGTTPAQSVALHLFSYGNGGTYFLYLDRIDPDATPLCTVSLLKNWNDYTLPLSTAVTGRHTLYLVPKTTAGTAAKFHSLTFSTSTGPAAIDLPTLDAPADPTSAPLYDLYGRPVLTPNPTPGLYIRAGQKVLIK